MAHPSVLSCSTLLAVVVLLFVLGVLVWGWGLFLDRFEHDPARVRAAMALLLLGVVLSEGGLATCGITYPWVAWLSLFANVWGGLDAVLRYPASHDLESVFAVKQFFLLLAKTFAYAVGTASFRRNVPIFLAQVVLNIWSLPVLYTMALPMDPAEQVAKDDAHDVDLAVRLWRLAAFASERRECLARCRGWWYRGLAAASEGSSIARLAICAASPEHRRVFKKMGRSV